MNARARIQQIPGVILVAMAALVVRLLYLWDSVDSPTFWTPIIDAGEYTALARAALATGRLSTEFFWQPFFYPAFLVGALALGGDSLLVVRLLQVAIGTATCALTYRLAQRVLSGRWPLVAGLLAALYGPLFFYDSELLGTSWETFWATALLLCLVEARASPALRVWGRFGLVAACCILTRPTYLPVLAAGLAWALVALVRARQTRAVHLAAAVGIFVAAAALPLLPVSLLSHRLTGSFSVLPYSGGLNLYIGNNPGRDATIAIRPGWLWDSLTRLPARHGIPPGRETARFFATQVGAYAHEQPLDFVHGLLAKTVQLVSSRELPRNESLYVQREWSPLLATLVWRVGPFGFPFGLLLPLALLGAWQLGRRAPVPLAAFVLLYGAAVVLVFPAARYRMPLIPPMLVLAAAGLATFAAAWRAGRRRQVLAMLAGAAGLAVATSLPGPFAQERADYRAEMDYVLGSVRTREGRFAEARALLASAVARAPGYSDAHNALGVVHERMHDEAGAVAAYRTAAELEPRNLTARLNLGHALYRQQDFPAARDAYLQVAAQAPRHAEARNRLAMTHLMQGNPTNAIPYLYESLQINPNDAAVHNNLASALNESGQTAEAIKHFEAAILLDPDLDLAVDNLGAMLEGQGRLDHARILYRAALVRATARGDADRAADMQRRLKHLVKKPE